MPRSVTLGALDLVKVLLGSLVSAARVVVLGEFEGLLCSPGEVAVQSLVVPSLVVSRSGEGGSARRV